MKGNDIVWPGQEKKQAEFEKQEEKKNIWKKNVNSSNVKQRKNVLDHEVTFSINPRKIMKGMFFVVMILGIFFLGRLSAGEFSLGIPTISGLSVGVDSEEVASVPVEPEAESEVKVEPEPEAATESEGNELTAAVVAEEEISINGNYNKVALSLSDMKIDWRETWGKITGVEISIKNSEGGTITPGYITMVVEGYDDLEKRIDFPDDLKTIKKGVTKKAMLNVPSGYAYNEVTAGNLNSVEIRLILFDQQGNPMASFMREMNLIR